MAGDSEMPVPPPTARCLQTDVTTAERVRRHSSVPKTRYEPLAPGVSALSARCLWRACQQCGCNTGLLPTTRTLLGYAVAQLVEALRNKPEGRGFDSRWCYRNFSLTYSFRLHYGPGVDSASNRNEYQEYFLGGKGGRCVWLTTLPHSRADCFEIWEPQPPGSLRACPGL